MTSMPPKVTEGVLIPELTIREARPGVIGQAGMVFPELPTVNDAGEMLQIFRTAVAGQTGLTHGELRSPDGTVCALGAFLDALGGRINISQHLLPLMEQLQQYNDSMPWATPQERRDAVLAFIDAKIVERNMPSHSVTVVF